MTLHSSETNHSPPSSEIREQALVGFHEELDCLGHDVEQSNDNATFLEQQNYLGLPANTEIQKEQILSIFNQLEISSSEPLSDLPFPMIKQMIQRRLNDRDVEKVETQFTSLFNALNTQSISNHDYLDQVIELARTDKTAVPEQYLTQYQQFQKLLSPTLMMDENDQQIISRSFDELDLTTYPDPLAFIQHEVLANDEISDETKNKVAKAFNLKPFEANSGTDIASGLTEKVINSQTGELEYRFDEGNKLEFRPGINAFNQSDTGRKMITAELADGRSRDFDVTGWPASDLTELSDYLMFWRTTEEAGLSNYIEDIFYVDMALIDEFDPAKARQSRQTIEALMGFNTGYDGEILTEKDSKFLTWMLQALSPKGDAVQGDYDIHSTNESLVELGIKDDSGQINFEILQSASSYLRGFYLMGQPNFNDLKDHLLALQ